MTPLNSPDDVIQRLREHERRLQELMDLLEGRRQLRPDDREIARGLYSTLRTDLEAESRAPSADPQARPSEAERAYFRPAVKEAFLHLRSSVQSHPVGSRWFQQLYRAKISLANYRAHLSRRAKLVMP